MTRASELNRMSDAELQSEYEKQMERRPELSERLRNICIVSFRSIAPRQQRVFFILQNDALLERRERKEVAQ